MHAEQLDHAAKMFATRLPLWLLRDNFERWQVTSYTCCAAC